MHSRDDLSCTRGYEMWMLQQALARNPAIKTCEDTPVERRGQGRWCGRGSASLRRCAELGRARLGGEWELLQRRQHRLPDRVCDMRGAGDAMQQRCGLRDRRIFIPPPSRGLLQVAGVKLDYIGIWNGEAASTHAARRMPMLSSAPPAERAWGGTAYVKSLRASLDAAGFGSTQIILPDGWECETIVDAALADPVFNASIAGACIAAGSPSVCAVASGHTVRRHRAALPVPHGVPRRAAEDRQEVLEQ